MHVKHHVYLLYTTTHKTSWKHYDWNTNDKSSQNEQYIFMKKSLTTIKIWFILLINIIIDAIKERQLKDWIKTAPQKRFWRFSSKISKENP